MDLQQIIKNFSYYQQVSFYGKRSTISFNYTIINQSLQLSLAPAINPNRTGRPQPGEQVFDYKKQVYFSLNLIECADICKNFETILKQQYINPNATNEQFKTQYQITHYKNNQPSYCNLSVPENSNILIVSINPPGAESVTFGLNGAQISVFRGMLDFTWKIFPGMCMLINGFCSHLRAAGFQDKNQPNNTSNQYNNQQSYGGEQQTPPQTSFSEPQHNTEPAPPTPAAPVESIGDWNL